MSIVPTREQKVIIEDDLLSQCVIACAGSGKTTTAVRRLLEIRRRIGNSKGYVALLSYSNIAVATFRKEYATLAREIPTLSNRVLIATVDSFISSHIVLPHAATTMGCVGRPFLVHGGEPFLNSFKVFNGSHGVGIEDLRVSLNPNGEFVYSETSYYGKPKHVDSGHAEKVMLKLGKTGAYTHDTGRYWSLQALTRQERLTEILARRYPHMLIDEAQDVGSMHGALLGFLQDAGSKVSLIGDPNQAIYEFADADGSFLRNFQNVKGTVLRPLTQNRRSVRQIVAVANALCSTDAEVIRDPPERKHGSYYVRYKKDQLDSLVDTFTAILKLSNYRKEESAILCRGNPLVERVCGGADGTGQGATDKFACASVCRDRQGDIATAFELTVDGVMKLLLQPPATLRRDVLGTSPEGDAKALRRAVWRFLKNSDLGLPDSRFAAKSKWHPLLKARVPPLLQSIEVTSALRRSDKWSYNLTKAKLGDDPLWQGDLMTENRGDVKTQTVHKVKGEGIGAVLYIAKRADVTNLLAGTATEEGRIGYVAITRARDLLLLAIPSNTPDLTVAHLESKGFIQWA